MKHDLFCLLNISILYDNIRNIRYLYIVIKNIYSHYSNIKNRAILYIVVAMHCCSKDYVDLTEWLLYYSDFSTQGVGDGDDGGGGGG